ncbi:Neurotrypsin [Holothuria leucospilota]|uniref:Neurotrypsin n=1 Tax=Holothuria leucospilota TaxID=206669 RepID=A0A9Q1BMH4_HOLLE|nr:Neurotrypsin [Holothuria leucospilota]
MDVLGIAFVRTLVCLLFIYVGVCESQEDRSVRIVSGPREGRVEIYFDGQWSTVSQDGWTETDAGVVCNQLGFKGPAIKTTEGPATLAFDVPKLSVNCPKGAKSLSECDIEKTAGSALDASASYLDGQTYWDHSQSAGVKCETESNVVQIVINVVGIVVVIAIICVFATLFYRFKKNQVPKESKPEEAKQETVAMYATQLPKPFADNPDDRTAQYCSINPVAVELENSYLELNQGDSPQQV